MLAGSSTSNSTDFIPGLAFVVSSKWPLRRPAMITWLPSLCSVSASPRPIPEPPPVMKIVLPVSFICFSFVLVGCNCFVRPPERMKKSLELAGQFSGIDSDGRTRDEGGLVRSEKHNGLGNLFGQPCTFKRHARNQCRLLLRIAGEPVQHPGLDGARGNYVDPHARPSYLQRSRLGQAFDRVLARDVNRRAGPTSPSKDGRHVDDTALPTR